LVAINPSLFITCLTLIKARCQKTIGKGLSTQMGRHISTFVLLQQSDKWVEELQQSGLLGVDIETSAVYSASE
jgi:purine-nucleoside phosphorylase